MYNVKLIDLCNISSIKSEWLRLQKGADMTYFQHYEWYEMLCTLNANISNKCFEVKFACVSSDSEIKLIAPLWIVKKQFAKHNKKGVYFFGRTQWSDYLNFIYDEFDSQMVEALFSYIWDLYVIENWHLEDIRKETYLSKFLLNIRGVKTSETVCVDLHIPETVEEYHKQLSKNARQNLRTARNRAIKDGIELVFDFDERHIDLTSFSKYRDVRLVDKIKWKERPLFFRIKYWISTKLLRRSEYKFVNYTPFEDDHNSRFITCKTKGGELCAAFNYGYDENRKEIVLMAVSTNPKFYKYSPGMLALYEYILNQIEKKEVHNIDFTRGNEKYKYALGGKEHYNVSFILPSRKVS